MATNNRNFDSNLTINSFLTKPTITISNSSSQSSQSYNQFCSNYKLAYHHHHHHIQTAIQMGQFYNPELAAAAAAALAMRGGNGSGGSGVGLAPIWGSSGGVGESQRSTPLGYHHHNHHNNPLNHSAPDLIGQQSTCDIWSGSLGSGSGGGGRIGGSSGSSSANGGMGQRFGHTKSSSKKPRRRVATMAQRRAANIRERRRMFNLNEAFDRLRRKVPTFAYEKRLSRIETLRLAITYISFMKDLMAVPVPGPDFDPSEREVKKSRSNNNNNNNNNNGEIDSLRNGQSHHHNHHNNNTDNHVPSSNGIGTNGPNHFLHGPNIGPGGNSSGNLGGLDCHQNQNVPPPISPFPMRGIYSPHHHHHHSQHPYLPSNIHH